MTIMDIPMASKAPRRIPAVHAAIFPVIGQDVFLIETIHQAIQRHENLSRPDSWSNATIWPAWRDLCPTSIPALRRDGYRARASNR